MDVKANVNLYTNPESKIKGFASLTLDGEFVVNGLKVLDSEKGLFVSMPSQKMSGGYKDMCFPITAELRSKIHDTVIEEYNRALEQANTQSKEQKNEQKEKAEGETDKKSGSKKAQRTGVQSKQDDNEELSEEGQDEQVDDGPIMSM